MPPRKLRMPCYGIVVTLNDDDNTGKIRSDLLKDDGDENPKDAVDLTEFTTAVNTIEAVILAHARVGVDILKESYIEGIETAVQSIFNDYT